MPSARFLAAPRFASTLALALVSVSFGCSRPAPTAEAKAEAVQMTEARGGWADRAPAGDAVRGEYLASIGACKECHTLRAKDGEHLDDKLLFGGGIPFDGPWGNVASANVSAAAADLPTDILEAAIRGQLAFKFQMPTDLYAQMADDDMRDLVAYVKTLPRVPRRNDTNVYDARWRPPAPLGNVAHPAKAPRGVTVERGSYLATIAICRDCHSPRAANGQGYDEEHKMAGGGLVLRQRDGRPLIPPNLTPDIETGLGSWSDAEIIRAIRTGIAKDGHRLNPAMPYEVGLQVLTDEDVQAIVKYLRSIPPIRRRLPENAEWKPGDPPDACCYAGPTGGYGDDGLARLP